MNQESLNERGVIYKITNIINHKSYIGQTTKSFNERYRGKGYGVERVLNSPKANKHLVNSIKKYGCENFTVEIIDDGKTIDELNLKEQYWIKHYRSHLPQYGYNFQLGGDNHTIQRLVRTMVMEFDVLISLLSENQEDVSISDLVESIKTNRDIHKSHKGELQVLVMRHGLALAEKVEKRKSKTHDVKVNRHELITMLQDLQNEYKKELMNMREGEDCEQFILN